MSVLDKLKRMYEEIRRKKLETHGMHDVECNCKYCILNREYEKILEEVTK